MRLEVVQGVDQRLRLLEDLDGHLGQSLQSHKFIGVVVEIQSLVVAEVQHLVGTDMHALRGALALVKPPLLLHDAGTDAPRR